MVYMSNTNNGCIHDLWRCLQKISWESHIENPWDVSMTMWSSRDNHPWLHYLNSSCADFTQENIRNFMSQNWDVTDSRNLSSWKTYHTQTLPWLLMVWWCKKPAHQLLSINLVLQEYSGFSTCTWSISKTAGIRDKNVFKKMFNENITF